MKRVTEFNPFRFTSDKAVTLWQNDTIKAFIHEFELVPIQLVTPFILTLIRAEWQDKFEMMRDDPDLYNATVEFLNHCRDHWHHYRAERNRAIKEHRAGRVGFFEGLTGDLFRDSDFGSENYVSSSSADSD